MQPPDMRTAVIDGLAEFGIVLQQEFRFDAPASLGILYAAVYSALAARNRANDQPVEDEEDKKGKKKKRDTDADDAASASFSEKSLQPQRGHISRARAEQLLKETPLKRFYRA